MTTQLIHIQPRTRELFENYGAQHEIYSALVVSNHLTGLWSIFYVNQWGDVDKNYQINKMFQGKYGWQAFPTRRAALYKLLRVASYYSSVASADVYVRNNRGRHVKMTYHEIQLLVNPATN